MTMFIFVFNFILYFACQQTVKILQSERVHLQKDANYYYLRFTN